MWGDTKIEFIVVWNYLEPVFLEVITEVVVNSTCTILWGIMSCRKFKFNRPFGETCRIHLQRRRMNQPRNQHESDSKQTLPSKEPARIR
jgi:hypothetical protein